ncbi:feruloyl-CoA synthase [Capillimicrobium parvum]|uniref:2-succinylbenzoate--CoA ligase n=1 Tax=Capillimicrobium parvum TaxID=2884022 RepID=A0A9E7BZB3_9ACTN|nr:feruloyl-CoA synthase [Capillimicrobium parvum]UGS34394.1 2-succinylbenzoate--CoA ligase [Capillimicrobium parvum]
MTAGATRVFATPRVLVEDRGDVVLLRSADELGEHAPTLGHLLRRHGERAPDALLAAQRHDGGWRRLTWGDARHAADAVGQAMLDRGLGADRPLMILSGNSIEHLVMALGAHTTGVPVIPVSTAYSLASRDHARIRAIAALCSPGMVFADDPGPYGAALDAVAAPGRVEVVARGQRAGAVRFDDLVRTPAGPDVERAFAAVTPQSVAKLLFTSGSTGVPKGVVNTHGMLCSNQQAIGQVWPFMAGEPPVLVDWLPWSHTFGGNHNLGQVLAFGGSIHIDDAKPTAEDFPRSIAALRAIRPTVYYNVPAGYAQLACALEDDHGFARAFFSRLRFMFSAAAALEPALWDRLRAVADAASDHDVPLIAGWGATETGPGLTAAHWHPAARGCIGLPLPGVTLKLVARDTRWEAMAKGPGITPGYFGQPGLTAQTFDSDGFFRTGDACRFVDETDPHQGLVFDGRLGEDFKLVTGTWVRAGRLRTALLAEAGVLADAVIAGENERFVGALAWVDQTRARRRYGGERPVALDHPGLRDDLARALQALNEGQGSASRIERLVLLDEPPSIDSGEVTDKGSLNRRAVLQRRGSALAELFGDPASRQMVEPDRAQTSVQGHPEPARPA